MLQAASRTLRDDTLRYNGSLGNGARVSHEPHFCWLMQDCPRPGWESTSRHYCSVAMLVIRVWSSIAIPRKTSLQVFAQLRQLLVMALAEDSCGLHRSGARSILRHGPRSSVARSTGVSHPIATCFGPFRASPSDHSRHGIDNCRLLHVQPLCRWAMVCWHNTSLPAP